MTPTTPPDVRAHLHHFGGRPCLALANTVLWRRGEARDLLVGYGDVLHWWVRLGLLDAGEAQALGRRAEQDPSGAVQALERLHEVRELVYRVFARVAADEPADAADLARLSAELAAANRHAAVVPDVGGYRWAFPGAGEQLESPLWAPLRSAAETLVGDDLSRLKQCPGPTCGWLFLDETRSRTRRWCEPGECGNRQRARDYYARRRRGAA